MNKKITLGILIIIVLVIAYSVFEMIVGSIAVERIGSMRLVDRNKVYHLELFNDEKRSEVMNDYVMVNQRKDSIFLLKYINKYQLLIYKINQYRGVQIPDININRIKNDKPEFNGPSNNSLTRDSPTIDIGMNADFGSDTDGKVDIDFSADYLH